MSEETLNGEGFAFYCYSTFINCGLKWKLFYEDDLTDMSDVVRPMRKALIANGFTFLGYVWVRGFDTLDEATLAKLKLPGGVQLADHSNEPWTLEARP